MPGQLFTTYFLEEGIRRTEAWQEALSEPSELESFRAQAFALLENAASFHSINEASTEHELIRPLLELLGWADYLPQQGSDSNEDIPDHLLFGDADAKTRAANKPAAGRYVDALAVAESKRFGRPLEAHDKDDHGKPGTPHAQILRYLATADISSDGRIRWGILTNGNVSGASMTAAPARAPAATTKSTLTPPPVWTTPAPFSPSASSSAGPPSARATARRPASSRTPSPKASATRNRSQTTFPVPSSKRSTPLWSARSPKSGGADLENVRQASLILLYRLLFLLYAEDRDLLPVNDSRYDDYGLRKSVRDDIDRRMKLAGDVFSSASRPGTMTT